MGIFLLFCKTLDRDAVNRDRHSPFAMSEQAPSGSLALIISRCVPSALAAAVQRIVIGIRRSP
jgi:hypothetical protein